MDFESGEDARLGAEQATALFAAWRAAGLDQGLLELRGALGVSV